jgi:Flp pilus assembly pilin Flp
MRVALEAIDALDVESGNGSGDRATTGGSMEMIKKLLLDESGQGMTEYAILIGTLALGAIVTLLAIGTRLRNVFGNVQTQLNTLPTS